MKLNIEILFLSIQEKVKFLIMIVSNIHMLKAMHKLTIPSIQI